jgi:NAD(P)-dependent dehydrogenase (short-subunit alcohol dehydrogenase family)
MPILAGKRALITGGSRGLGRTLVERFTREGARVAFSYARDESGASAALASADGARAFRVSVLDVAGTEAMIADIERDWGGVDILVNNAGISQNLPLALMEEDDWDRVMDVNVKGTFLCSRAALRHLGEGAAIVNQGSVSALVGIPNFAAYCAAKGAVVALTRSMAIDLAPRRIRVNVICPGTVYTPLMQPMLRARGDGDLDLGLARTLVKYPIGRLGSPEDIANVALFLASDEAAFMTGSVVTPDGGMTAQ